MSNESGNKSSGGIGVLGVLGVLGLLGIVFVTLKLLGISEVATWSWLWVLAPFWMGAAVFLAFPLIYLIIAVIFSAFSK